MEFRNITLEDKSWLERLRDPEAYPLTAYAFPSLFMWRQTFGLTIAGDEHVAIVHSRQMDGYFFPCGEEAACKTVLEELLKQHKSFCIKYLTEQQAKWLQKWDGFQVQHEPDDSEYLYDCDIFAHPTKTTCRAIHRKRNAFAKSDPYTIREVTPNDQGTLLNIVEEWAQQKGDEADTVAAREGIRHMEALGMNGILMETAAGNAFSLGYENSEDVYTIALCKFASGVSPDAIAVCYHEHAKRLESRYSTIDLEEDMGDTGMREMKNRLHPSGFLNAYSAVFTME